MAEKEKIRVEELVLSDELNPTGVFAIGLVGEPAHEEEFIFMSKAEKKYYAMASDEKHMIYGPAIIPEKKILQYDENNNPFYVFFSEETVVKLSQNFLKNYSQKAFTFQHNEYVESTTLVENWIINDSSNDKAKSLGFDLPKGTWMMGIKVDNVELWEKIKDGTAKGLSIEAYMASKIIENSLSKGDRIVKQINDILKENK